MKRPWIFGLVIVSERPRTNEQKKTESRSGATEVGPKSFWVGFHGWHAPARSLPAAARRNRTLDLFSSLEGIDSTQHHDGQRVSLLGPDIGCRRGLIAPWEEKTRQCQRLCDPQSIS
jgi:hypothetical protein